MSDGAPPPPPPPGPSEGSESLTVPAASVRFGIPEDSLQAWIASGALRAFRDRGEVLLKADEVERVLAAGRPAPDPGEPDLVPLPDLAIFLGIETEELARFLDGGPLPLIPDAAGTPAVRREEIARLLLGTAGRAALLDAAGSAWTEQGEPAPVPGEGEADELEEDATEETRVGAPPPSPPPVRGAITVRYYERMTPRRSYPIVVQAARIPAPLRAVPRLPGCLCVPAGLDLTPEEPKGEFWVTPQAVGPVPRGAVDFLLAGTRAAEVRTPFTVRTLAGAWVFLALAALFLALAPVLDAVEETMAPDSPLRALLGLFGGGMGTGLILSTLSFVGGGLWFFWAQPREGRPLTVSLSGAQHDSPLP